MKISDGRIGVADAAKINKILKTHFPKTSIAVSGSDTADGICETLCKTARDIAIGECSGNAVCELIVNLAYQECLNQC